ncbi:MAG: hypothetical protein VX777_09575 [Chlamydiota bacterium]|nr:hypothetical protein [Chlamydiota bacterium]
MTVQNIEMRPLNWSWTAEDSKPKIKSLNNLREKIHKDQSKYSFHGSEDKLIPAPENMKKHNDIQKAYNQLFSDLTGPVDIDFHKRSRERYNLLKVHFELQVTDPTSAIIFKKVDLIGNEVFILSEIVSGIFPKKIGESNDQLFDVHAVLNVKLSETYSIERLARHVHYFVIGHKKVRFEEEPGDLSTFSMIYFMQNQTAYDRHVDNQIADADYIDTLASTLWQSNCMKALKKLKAKYPKEEGIQKMDFLEFYQGVSNKPFYLLDLNTKAQNRQKATELSAQKNEWFWIQASQPGHCYLL